MPLRIAVECAAVLACFMSSKQDTLLPWIPKFLLVADMLVNLRVV